MSGQGGLHAHTHGGLHAHTQGGSPGPHPGGCIPACTEADPPMATAAGGTHPTGMHSCYLLLPYHSNIPQLVKLAPIDKMKRIQLHSSYFSGLTKFPDFDNIFPIFPVFFDVLFLTEIF